MNNSYVTSLLNEKYRSSLLASKYATNVRAINGMGATAAAWVECLERLTLREGLDLLTMLRWKNVLPHKFLSRKTRAWCPRCFEESAADGKVVYEKLAWTIQAVTACARHRCHLCVECPQCGRQNPVLSSRSRPGCCPSCGRWLGRQRQLYGDCEVNKDEFSQQSTVFRQLGELFSAAKSVTTLPERTAVARSVLSCVNKIACGSYPEAGRKLGVPGGKIRFWATGRNLPELGALLRLCRVAGESPVDTLLGHVTYEKISVDSPPKNLAGQKTRNKKTCQRRWRRLDLEETWAALEASLKSEYPPPSLKDLSIRLNRSSSTLRYQFPKLCRLIIEKFRKYTRKQNKDYYRKIERALRSALRCAAPAPTLEDLIREFKCHRSVFLSNLPSLCDALRKRNEEDRKKELLEVERLLLHAATTEYPPRSFRAFCESVGRSDQSLRDLFPELCARVSARYSSYLSESMKKRRDERARLVREVAYALYAEGVYPSVLRVQSRITSFCVRSSDIALSVLRQVRRELQFRAVKAA